MLKREKTFSNRGYSAKSSRVQNLFRPSSSKARTQYPSININSSASETPPPIIFTMPNIKKLTSGMGNNIEREQLYENNMKLKESLNKLERQLRKSKYLNVKSEIELRKKEKLIKDYIKENSKDLMENRNNNNNENKMNPVMESALLTLCKQKYNNIKAQYEKSLADNKILKANIKLTNIKEFQIENDVLNKELKKMKALYENSKAYYDKYKENLEKLKEMRDKFIEQHTIVLTYEKKMELLNEQIKSLNEENLSLRKDVDNANKKREKLNIKNKILEIKNKKLLENKKLKESTEFQQNNYKKDYEDQKKEIFELKSALNVRVSEIQSLQKLVDTYKQLADKKDNTAIVPINYENFKHIEKQSYPQNIDKIELYKSLYDESLLIISIYEKYLTEKNINPKYVLKKYGYKGVLNSSNKVAYNLNEKIKEKDEKNNYENDNNTDEILSNTNTKPFSNVTQNNENNENMNNNENLNNNENMNNNENINNDEIMKEKENFFLSLFIKNLEARKVSTEIMKNKINTINDSFKDKPKISIEEFITPFINMLKETMQITQEIDQKHIEKFLYDYLNYLQNNMKEFINRMNNAFENIIDYDLLQNKEELLNSLAFNLQKYKNELIQKLKEADKNNLNIISFQDFMKILSDLGDPIRMELIEFLLYLMKKDTDVKYSMFDFNYNTILDLLERKLPEDYQDIINENENDEISQLISNKLSEFKYNMEQERTNLEKVCEEKVKKLEVKGNNFEVIEKKDFFDFMEKYNVELNEQIKDVIYKLFAVEEPEINKDEKMQFMDYIKLKNLFLNNYYEEENN